MRYFLCLVALILVAFIFVSCEDIFPQQIGINTIMGNSEEPKADDNEYIEPAVEQFREPSDLSINYKKARNFNKASEALVIMGQEWADKMAQVDDEEKLRMAASYEKAQDDLIRKFGINGKEEFKWIQTKALPEHSNRDVFARAGVWISR